MKKRLLAAIMSLCMIVSLLPVSALAVETRQLPSSDTITVGETRNYTGTVGDGGHSWTSSNKDIASVESGGWFGANEKASVTGHRPGTVTITHTYKEWVGLPIIGHYEEHKQKCELTVQQDSTPGNHTAYFYVVNPETAQEPYTGREDEYFNYLGVGTVNNIPAADAEGYRGEEFWIGSDQETSGWTNTPPEFPLDITYHGTPYKYWDNVGTPPEHYYTVTWYRYSSSSGYVDQNGTEHDSETMCWHVDGYVDLNDMVQVRFQVKFPGDKDFSYVDANGNPGNERNIWYVEENSKFFSGISNPPDMETNAPEGYVFKGWYTDEACNDPVDNETVIDRNMTFYGKYEEDVPDITVMKKLDASTVHAGEDAVWTITVTNNTDATISDLKISDSLTVDGTPVSGDYTSGGVSISPKSNPTDNLNSFIVEENSSRTFTAQYKVKTDDVGKELVNTATVTTATGETYHDTATNTVQAVVPTEPDLSVTKSVTLSNGAVIPDEGVNVGDTLKYTVTVTNSGAAADASTVVVTDSKFPENKNNVTVTSSSGAETVAWSGSSATITSELAKGESVTFTYTYPVTEQDQYEGTVSNTASVTFNNVKQDTATRDVSVKAKTYSLTYNANYGTFENSKTTFVVNGLESGTEYPLGKEEDYQKPTHAQENLNGETVNVAFIGWTLSNNSGFIYSANAPNLPQLEDKVTIQSPGVTVYAVWGYDKDSDGTADVLEHTVTFDAQGGTPVPETQYVQDNETATEPTDPTKDGFTFAGWTLNGEPYDFTDPVTSDIELVAQWTDATRYTVTYNANNGTLIGASSVTVIPGRAVQLESSATRDGYIFMGWTTEPILGQTYGVGASLPETIFQRGDSFIPTGNTTLYAVWSQDTDGDKVPDVNEVFIAPADITIYTGGTGYSGVTDEDGNVIDEYEGSGLPEPGFHIVLPADLDIREGSNLENVLTFHYSGEDTLTGTTVDHTWTLSYVGVYSMNPTRYVYSLNPNEAGTPIRILYKDGAGAVQDDDQIDMSANAASAEYTMSINPGGLTPTAIQAEITKLDGSKVTRNLVIGTGELTIRSTVDDDTTPIADNAGEVSGGSFTAVHTGASYKVNDSEVDVPTTGDRVQLLVDQVSNSTAFNNAMGEAALDHPQVNGTAFETVYLDLVDTQNGNTVVTLDSGSMDIYWPMPSNADPYGDFQVVHYVDMNREVSTTEDQLDNQRTELLDGTAERINGDWYVRFTTHSFSPFVLVYEEDTSRPVNPNPGGGSGGGDDHDPTGNLSIELDVNGGDDEFTFTVILTDKDGDDLENNFYYNGDYTGTIGSGDEITLEGGDKIVIRNLPEGTRYEVIIETADGYTYVIDGEEGVIHTGMNEAEFTATRTVPVADPSVTGVSRWLNTTDHIAYLTGYPGGAFGPNNNMTRAEVAQMFYALLNNKNVTITKTFPDVPADAWYAAAVNTLASLGMVSGDENGNYRPNDPITRAEFCVIALAFAYEPENAVCYFGDVSRSDWFYTYVAQAASYGWIGGYTNGNFGPNDRITRAQVTTIVNNMLGRAADRDYVIDHQADLVQFTDLTRAHWGYFQIMEATNAHDYTKSNGTENWR